MPKVAGSKITRRSAPLKPTPTLKVKAINRVRTSTGRATSKTQKIEQRVQHPTPAPLHSDFPELTPAEALEVTEEEKQEEQEEQESKVRKGTSRAVSVSFSPIDVSWADLMSQDRLRYLSGFHGLSRPWTESSVWMASLVVVYPVLSASSLVDFGAKTARVSISVVKTASLSCIPTSPSIALRFVQTSMIGYLTDSIFAAMEWAILRQSSPRLTRPHAPARSH